MSLYVFDGRWIHACYTESLRDHLCLTANTGCGQADLCSAVVIDGRSFDNRVNSIPVVHSVIQPPKRYYSGARSANRSGCTHIQRTAVAIRARDPTLLV